MKKMFLFSQPEKNVMDEFVKEVFWKNFGIFGYMPANGADVVGNMKYVGMWKELCLKFGWDFVVIDNSKEDDLRRLDRCDAVLLCGGNTFELMRNLRVNGYGEALSKKWESSEDFVLAGFSAGAVVLGVDISVVLQDWAFGADENKVDLENMRGLGLVDFQVLPHFDEKLDVEKLTEYRKSCGFEVKEIKNDGWVVL